MYQVRQVRNIILKWSKLDPEGKAGRIAGSGSNHFDGAISTDAGRTEWEALPVDEIESFMQYLATDPLFKKYHEVSKCQTTVIY